MLILLRRRSFLLLVACGITGCVCCDAPLHTGKEGSPGYVEPATYDLVSN
jgi:nitric-oxide synthase